MNIAGNRSNQVSKKLKLLFIGAFPPSNKKIFGGNVTDCKILLDAGLANHFDLILLDSTQRTVPPPPVWRRLMYALPRIWNFVYLTKKNRPDAILIFASTGLSFIEKSFLAILGRIFKSCVMFFPRGGRLMDECRQSNFYRCFVRLMMRFPNILLCQGEVWRNFFVNELELGIEKCAILTNWTATADLLEIGSRRCYDTNNKIKILFLGSLNRSKGVFELIDAFSQLISLFPYLELVIAGEGKDSDEALIYVKEKGLNKNVFFTGWIEGERKLYVLSDSDIFCLPSHVEGLPNSMIEAMAVGLPVIITPVGSVPDVITDGENGLLTPLYDSVSLAHRIELLVVDQALRMALGRAAHETARTKFNPVKAVQQLVFLAEKDKISE